MGYGQAFWIGLLGLAAIALCWALAVVLFRVGQAGSVARKLSVLLVVEGLVLATAGFPDFVLDLSDEFYINNVWYDIAATVLHFSGDAAMIALYPPFLAAALGTALTRPFTKKRINVALAAAAVVIATGAILGFGLLGSTLGITVLYISVTLLFLFALIASINAWRNAKSGIAKTRAGLFAVAFGVRDLFWCFTYGASFWMSATGTFSPENPLFWNVKIVYALGTVFAVPLIAYGILRAHLFDIDLMVRWTITQSTLAALIVAFIFLVSEGVSTFLSAELGTVAGLFAAAVVMFFLTPLQQFAERVASSAMPNTKNTPEYIAFRKMQVYEAALVDAMKEGGISAKERALLGHLRDSLGISLADAEAIEQELQAGGAVPPSPVAA
ncbi:MAG: hypothetical protein R3348_08025 [Xanthomonadales bacterium]|nr:hypothetical protein [Xanthomonadales bacterium]